MLVLLVLSFFSCVIAGASPPKTVSATLRETQVRGMEGLNIKLAFPFQFDDYTVGFKHSFCDFNKAPEELFIQKTIDLGKDTFATVDAEYNTASNVFSMGTQLVSNRLGLSLAVDGDSANKLKRIDLSATRAFGKNKVGMAVTLDNLRKRISAMTSIAREDTVVSLNIDSQTQNPELSVGHKLDDHNIIAPCLSLRDGSIRYAWTRRWTGGSLESSFFPGEKVTLDWCDAGTNGLWRTRATIPLEDTSKSTVSITRDWKY